MSIRDEIHRLRAEGELVWLQPKRPTAGHRRVILLTKDLHEAVIHPELDKGTEHRIGKLRADLDLFSSGRLIVIGGKDHNTCLLKRLEPPEDEVWELRSRDPKPGLRLFGAFAEQDVFVGLKLHERVALGKEGSRQWRDAILGFKTEWKRFFLTYRPCTGETFNAYLSENFVDATDLER